MTDSPLVVLRRSAMDSLARREHSRVELERKLAGKFPNDRELISQVMDRLAEEGLQSDSRYVESYCRARAGRGYGPRHIVASLKIKGVNEEDARVAIETLDIDWFALAAEVLVKRFGGDTPENFREKARRMRFLQYRGFDNEQVEAAFDALTSNYCGS